MSLFLSLFDMLQVYVNTTINVMMNTISCFPSDLDVQCKTGNPKKWLRKKQYGQNVVTYKNLCEFFFTEKTHGKNALQKHTRKTHCTNTLEKCTKKIQKKRTFVFWSCVAVSWRTLLRTSAGGEFTVTFDSKFASNET